MSGSGPINSTRELREELDAVANRARDSAFIRDSTDEPEHSVPNDDEQWSVTDVLGEMMAGMYAHRACIEVYGYRLYLLGHGDELPNVWAVHPPEDADRAAAIDALNLDQFRTASEIETYLLEGDLRNEE